MRTVVPSHNLQSPPRHRRCRSCSLPTINDLRTTDFNLVTIPRSGAYTLLIEGTIGNTGTSDYVFNVQPEIITTQPLALDTLVSGNVATVGARNEYAFSLSEWSLLYFDALVA